MVTLDLEMETATRLARLAGETVLRYFRTGLEVARKAGDEPVTKADLESEAILVAGLAETFPEDGILSEERADKSTWSRARRAWVVDPLDGTKDFVSGWDGFSVMVGLLEEGRPILGVVHQPVTGATYRAARGDGAELLFGDGASVPLRTTGRVDLASLRLVASKSHREPSIDRVKAALGTEDEQNVGSVGLKVGLIARGERDLYVNAEGHCRLWDTCAPEIILAEAGGRMTDLFGAPLRYRAEALRLESGIVASNGACHGAVVAKLAPLFGGEPPY
jgi:3'(2'), 5'-bisphosphate nucleotidase